MYEDPDLDFPSEQLSGSNRTELTEQSALFFGYETDNEAFIDACRSETPREYARFCYDNAEAEREMLQRLSQISVNVSCYQEAQILDWWTGGQKSWQPALEFEVPLLGPASPELTDQYTLEFTRTGWDDGHAIKWSSKSPLQHVRLAAGHTLSLAPAIEYMDDFKGSICELSFEPQGTSEELRAFSDELERNVGRNGICVHIDLGDYGALGFAGLGSLHQPIGTQGVTGIFGEAYPFGRTDEVLACL